MVTERELEQLVDTLALDHGATVLRSTSRDHGVRYQVLDLAGIGKRPMPPIQFAEAARAWLAAKVKVAREEGNSIEAAQRLLNDLESRQGEPTKEA